MTHVNHQTLKELSVAGLLAQAIIRVYERESVSVLFD